MTGEVTGGVVGEVRGEVAGWRRGEGTGEVRGHLEAEGGEVLGGAGQGGRHRLLGDQLLTWARCQVPGVWCQVPGVIGQE